MMVGCLTLARAGFRARRLGLSLAVAGLGLLAAADAQATVTDISEMLSTYSTYAYDTSFQGGTATQADGDSHHYSGTSNAPGAAANTQLDFESVAAQDGSFDYLQNLRCVGSCLVKVQTWVEDVITNNSDVDQYLRFDSQVTAGHIGFQGAAANSQAGFSFLVTQIAYDPDGNAIADTVLYDAAGGMDTVAGLEAGFGSNYGHDHTPFNGLTSYANGNERAFDWGATNLNLYLDVIHPGQSATITFDTQSYIYVNGSCDDLTACDGAELIFGDPRNQGGVVPNITGFGRSLFQTPNSSCTTVIDCQFVATTSPFQVVAADAPLPPAQRPFFAPQYTPGPFAAGAVPEPASWAMMLVGFGAIGAAARRQRRSTRFA
jgi:hypothetical protein